MGGALDAPKVFLRRRVKPLRLGKTGAFVLDAIQGANAVLGLMQAGDLSGLLVMSVKGLISCNPSIIAMVPDKNYNTTGPRTCVSSIGSTIGQKASDSTRYLIGWRPGSHIGDTATLVGTAFPGASDEDR